jgi:hypothetical protein
MSPYVSEVQQKSMELSCVAFWLFLVVSVIEGKLGLKITLKMLKCICTSPLEVNLNRAKMSIFVKLFHHVALQSVHSKLWWQTLSIITLHGAMV